MSTLTATVKESGQGERRWFYGGGLQTWLATSEETNGAFLLVEFVGEQGKVTPLHFHPGVDETFYVLDGEILLDLSGERRSLSTGGVAVMPRGVPHAFMVTSTEARILTMLTPGLGRTSSGWPASRRPRAVRRSPSTSTGSGRRQRPLGQSKSSARRRSEVHLTSRRGRDSESVMIPTVAQPAPSPPTQHASAVALRRDESMPA